MAVPCSSSAHAGDVHATWLVEAEDHDTARHYLPVCSHPVCVGEAEARAETTGRHIDTRPLELDEAADLTGLDLAAELVGAVA